MSNSIYSRLAFTNLKNNRKTYLPYLLTSILTVMMFYMIDALTRNESITDKNITLCLGYATAVVLIFAVIFLFYTNSFLIKRRKKEIGVYNILGMGKRHIAKMLVIETLITTVSSIAAGLAGGIIFGKLMYLVLLKILHYDVGMNFAISTAALRDTLCLFLVIFALTLAYNLLQIRLSNPIELLRGSSQGEKEPKTKIFLTVAGVILIGIGYYIALTTESPLAALQLFFVAVICVILGTYALFTAGSITLLKLLRKNKKFYYQTKHFTSVSGMIYRMKQNAVGLANICILSTMVLVMISTSVSLYMGMDDVLRTRFPKEIETEVCATLHPEAEQQLDNIIKEEIEKAGVELESDISYHRGSLAAVREGDKLILQNAMGYASSDMMEIQMIPVEDYNRMEKKQVSLAEDEILVYTSDEMYGKDTMQLGEKKYRVAEELTEMKMESKNKYRVVKAYYIIMPDAAQIQEYLNEAYQDEDPDEERGMSENWIEQMKSIDYVRKFDLEGDEEDCAEATKAIRERISEEVPTGMSESREMSRESFYMLYGGLLFIGIYLGVMFLMATVLIIYYKQISEGYDDAERYQIMQKVGMSKEEVKSSIRSQVISVFFLPLVTAVVHIAVAFGVITKLLAVLNLTNVPLFFVCTVVTVLVFAVFYGIVYAVTAREYYKIVN